MGVGDGWMGVGHAGVEEGGVSLGLSLADGGLQVGGGSNSQSSTVGVLLLVQSGGTEEGGNLVDSSHEVTVVTSVGLVTSDSDWDSLASGHNLVVDGQGLDGNSWDGVWVGSVWIGGVGVWEDGDLGISGPLAVVSEDGGVDQGAGASLEADSSVTLLLVDSQGGDEAGNLVNWSLEVTIVSGLGLVTSDSYGDTVASDHG